ncbi:MAG: hypothetical protein KatS3mg035_0978 [Bacteroidia bacterium]|nr:MAG: hypothetical protein KatS3mg035_0978 [Bacteroidia bacterium]
MEEKRKCWICKIEKDLTSDNFNKDSVDRLGFQKACKTCQRERMAKYRKENKEYFKSKQKEHYKKEDNPARYQKYKLQYLERRASQSKSVRGKLYDLLEAARGRAKKNNLEIDIDLNFLLDLYTQQEGKCKLTNIDFTFKRREDGVHFNPFNPSIDKINPFGGYTKNNIRLVCTIVNLALNNFGEDSFKIMCEAYINNSKNKKGEK